MQNRTIEYYVGIDVGSTTTKIAAVRPSSGEVGYFEYRRHAAAQTESVVSALRRFEEAHPGAAIRAAMTGSGAKPIADRLGLPFVQEVVANAAAIRHLFRDAGTAIELGGQDAKMIFFQPRNPEEETLKVSDMRMNGSCAGGTGAFLDETAAILKVKPEELESLASRGDRVYPISGRCGVFAKTDLQPLLNQGAAREDLALSALHAIAKQTIGGLAQGLEIRKPVVFLGGPLHFNPTLVRVFRKRLSLKEDEVLIPEHPEITAAMGAALSIPELFPQGTVPGNRAWNGTGNWAGNGTGNQAGSENGNWSGTGNGNWAGNGIGYRPGTGQVRTEWAGELADRLLKLQASMGSGSHQGPLYFETPEEKEQFLKRHQKPERPAFQPGQKEVRAYLGIDSGSTTTKFVLMDEDENLLDSFYAPNGGAPLEVAKNALIALRERFKAAGTSLKILAAGSTGYGEMLFHKAFGTETHTVETVAHARAAGKYVEDATFILDIGGQDMKAIWLDHGVITNIVVNEACSSGCGSFLGNFAAMLNIPQEKIAEEAFASEHPAELGSRCTVFMNSSVITEQRNGRLPGDIVAGLCRSIIENVFTKVIRISNISSLGERIVVQGGTFENDAVLRAMEQYVGREVVRAPYPGLMGAIGAALLAKEEAESRAAAEQEAESRATAEKAESRRTAGGEAEQRQGFIPLGELERFSYTQNANSPCPFCENHCRRAVIRFSNGTTWITNNRCERGEVLGNPRDEAVREQLKQKEQEKKKVPNLFTLREELLFRDYPAGDVPRRRNLTIGLPRVLFLWDTMPFFSTFFRALGFRVRISPKSTRRMYEAGLQAVPSDTVCFPAKLVHGHLRELERLKVDRIFMPSVTVVPSENTEKHSESMCAVVKGYPIVIRNSDNPKERSGIPFDAPLFHWYTEADRNRQLTEHMKRVYGIPAGETARAIDYGDSAMRQFRRQLLKEGQRVLAEAEKSGGFAVVLASRPYQNDPLVNHDLPELFTGMGIPVLTADSLPGANQTDLSKTRIDVVNNFHARMLSSAVLAARSKTLEYVQLVSFGCGHDAYLSDEIIRLMRETSGKSPLILKLDESDARGPLQIRVRSFVETLRRQRRQFRAAASLPDPYLVKFRASDARRRVLLVPNTSHAFSRIMAAAVKCQNLRAVSLPVGREEASRLGKQYVHNDICFPAQMVIGEILAALKSGKYDPDRTGVFMAKYLGDCRLTHYSALLRKALDDAGFSQVPVVTNDLEDAKNLHPGYRLSFQASARIGFALPMIDILEELLRKVRPYETCPGSADVAFERGMNFLVHGMESGGIKGLQQGFRRAIEIMKTVEYDRSELKPQVLIVGEYLLNFHPGANREIERWLENNGMEVVEARMTDVIRKTYFYQEAQVRQYHVKKPLPEYGMLRAVNEVFRRAGAVADRIAAAHPLYKPAAKLEDIARAADPVIPRTFDAGEGILIPGEILHHAEQGLRNVLILQPFGCLPNHIVGRGIAKKLREKYPDMRILSLDYDPDISQANLENRLQMLVMNARGDLQRETKRA